MGKSNCFEAGVVRWAFSGDDRPRMVITKVSGLRKRLATPIAASTTPPWLSRRSSTRPLRGGVASWTSGVQNFLRGFLLESAQVDVPDSGRQQKRFVHAGQGHLRWFQFEILRNELCLGG